MTQSYVPGDHTLLVGLEHLDQPRQRESKISGSLDGISINQRPVLGLNQLTVSLTEPSGLTSLSRFGSFSSSLFDLRREIRLRPPVTGQSANVDIRLRQHKSEYHRRNSSPCPYPTLPRGQRKTHRTHPHPSG